jgi:hypothetical protein
MRNESPSSPPRRTSSAVENGVATVPPRQPDLDLVAKSIDALSKDIRDMTRRLQSLEASPAPSPTPAPTAPTWHFFVPVALLLGLIGVLLTGLWLVIAQSHADFGKGIEVATLGYSQGQSDPTAMARRIFLLASGHQIITFKAAAFVISALMFFVGAVFVLYKAEAAYDLRTESNTVKASLSTSSPGLVIITLAAALAIATLYAKSNVTDQPDFDLPAPQAAGSVGPPPAPSGATPSIDRAAEDETKRRIQATLDALGQSSNNAKKGANP